jgi:WD40-like Beta Propeller Repeat
MHIQGRILGAVATGAVGLASLVFVATAMATFPGRNGALALQPVSGEGIVLLNAETGKAHRVCAALASCGNPTKPVWSPNGKEIVFSDAHSRRIGIVAVGGSCLWCVGADPVISSPGEAAAFEPGGTEVSFISARSGSTGPLWSVMLGSSTTARLQSGRYSSADWSKSGRLAVARGGFVWIASSAHAILRRLLAGSQPSWSPDGTHLAFTRAGWIWIVDPNHGAPRRVIQGSSPEWSPDGRELAFVGAKGFIYVADKRGRHRRRLGSVRARSLSWQPVTAATSTTCKVPAAATIVGTSPASIVWSTNETDQTTGAEVTTWHACLRALGDPVSIGQATSNYDDTLGLGSLRIAGPYLAWYASAQSSQGGSCGGTLKRIDLRTKLSEVVGTSDCSVPSGTTIDSLQLNANGFIAWHQTYNDEALMKYYGPGVNAVSCPSTTLCVAADTIGNVYWSTDPSAGTSSWSFADIDATNGNEALSCPTTQLCVGFDGQTFPSRYPDLLTTTDPTGGIGAWTVASLPKGLFPAAKPNSYPVVTSLSCSSANFCAALSGKLLTSTDPAGGPSTWTASPLPRDKYALLGLSCPSSRLCVAVDGQGDVLTSTDPTGGAAAWTITDVDPAEASAAFGIGGSPQAVSCPSVSLCVAIDGSGRVLTSTDPVAHTWKTTTLLPNATLGSVLQGITCTPTADCIAGNAHTLFDSSDPAGGTSAWASTAQSVSDGTCPSATLCVFFDGRTQLTSASAFTGSATWTPTNSMPYCMSTSPCIGEQIYSYDSSGAQIVAHVPPGTGDSLTHVSLGSDNVLSWDQNGAPQSETLR